MGPFLILFFQTPQLSWPDFSETLWAFQNAIIQSFFSASLSGCLGLFLCSGLLYSAKYEKVFSLIFLKNSIVKGKSLSLRSFLNFFCLIPSLLPSLFILLIFLAVVKPFPMGNSGIILIQGSLYAGLVGLTLASLIEAKCFGIIELCYIEGASPWRTFRALLGVLKGDIFVLLSLVFAATFTSFSIPLVIGAGKGTNVEILIYEKVRISQDWGQALALSFLQVFVVGVLALPKLAHQNPLQVQLRSLPLLGTRIGFLFLVMYAIFFSGTFLFQSLGGWPEVFNIKGLPEMILPLVFNTFFLSLIMGFFLWLALLFTAWKLPNPWLQKLLRSYSAPSAALIGFSMISISGYDMPSLVLKYFFGFFILIFASLYKMGMDQVIYGLQLQVQIAQTLGASNWKIFKEIIFPQISEKAGQVAGIGAVWIAGDFALCKMIIAKQFTLGVIVEVLMSSYRVEAAFALSGLLLMICLLVYFLLVRLGRVFSRKLG